MSKTTRQPSDKKAPSLTEFMRNKIKAACLVCQLPKEIRDQLGRSASKKGFSRPDQVEWLKVCGYTKITVEELGKHLNGKHEEDAT